MIFGESAGGSSVAMHLLMPRSWPFYSKVSLSLSLSLLSLSLSLSLSLCYLLLSLKAIMESPGPWLFPNQGDAITNGENWAWTLAPCNNSNPNELLPCLRNMSGQALLSGWNPATLAGNVPVIDQVQLMDTPANLFEQGTHPKKEIPKSVNNLFFLI